MLTYNSSMRNVELILWKHSIVTRDRWSLWPLPHIMNINSVPKVLVRALYAAICMKGDINTVCMECTANCLTIYVTTNIGVKIAFYFDVLLYFRVSNAIYTSLPFRLYFSIFILLFFENEKKKKIKQNDIAFERYTRLEELWLCECSLISTYMPCHMKCLCRIDIILVVGR